MKVQNQVFFLNEVIAKLVMPLTFFACKSLFVYLKM